VATSRYKVLQQLRIKYPILDIKITLSGNQERLNEIAKTFNESMQAIEFKKKETMMKSKKSTTQTLPPISETGPMATISPRRSYYPSRPMSAVTSRSMESKDGLYHFPSYSLFYSRAMQQSKRPMLVKQSTKGGSRGSQSKD
jgi:hypothetical protein